MKTIDNILQKTNVIKKINEAVESGLVLSLNGADIGEKVLSIYSSKKQCVVVAKDDVTKFLYKECLNELGIKTSEFITDLTPPIFRQIRDKSLQGEMIKSLYDFASGNSKVLLLSPENLLYKFHKKIDEKNVLKLQKNADYNFNEIIKKLIKNGYKKCEKIEKIGDFSIKGDILDIFTVNLENPIRLDFFGDTLEKIYFFDAQEMQKIEDLENINIYPNKLYILDEEEKKNIICNLQNTILNSNLQGDALIKNHMLIKQVCDWLGENIIDDDIEFLAPFLQEEYSIFEMLTSDIAIYVDEPKKLYDELADNYKSISASLFDFYSSGDLTSEHLNYYFNPFDAIRFKPNIVFSNIKQDIFKVDVNDTIRTIGSFNYCYDYKKLVNDLFIYEKSKYKVVLFAGSDESKKSLCEYLTNYNIYTSDDILFISNKFQVVVTSEHFSKSCSFLDSGLIKKSKSAVKNISGKNKKRKAFYLPKVGDYVVHETHGIGKCIALTKMNLNGTEKDYFVIEYSGGDKLYLPSEQADLISAFMGGDSDPKLNKIGGEQFAKVKQKVKESVSKLAINLVEIYAKREKSKGFVYSPDNYLYEQFEDAFPYEETEDQLSAIAEIKKDMQGPKIMDRLICGDVGYGKTEVALRAIYKAILDGKQVAFLCPTTILSEQHYKTAIERFSGFMVNVKVLNRFRSKQQQTQILQEVKDGKVDLLIGTHRLLSNDVVFKDLGLLVLDEEQRFGVGDKEKIKELKQNIDVLTLSATPIPRTLNMALTGIRDISIIETAPRERIAVKTYVQEESDTLILNACKKELFRGGQVLFVYNRVEHIYEQAERLKNLLPNARIGVAHGQMPEKLLEQTIMQLYNREFDILVATTLIESGIDLPFANTLIIIDADRLGLGELYQLRGRIGRSDKVAYAYFTYNPSKMLTSDAYKRLDAILEYTELGSGFKIAMRDLEIRGAGNILGKEQHGHLEKVGYDMYCKLLDSAVKELKGEKVKEIKPIKIDVSISANLPESYVKSESERIELYAGISSIANDSDYENMQTKLSEGYGELPFEAKNLLDIAYIKNLAISQNVKRDLIDAKNCQIYLYKEQNIMSAGLSKALSERPNGVLKFEDLPIIAFEMGFCTISQKIAFMLSFLKDATKF